VTQRAFLKLRGNAAGDATKQPVGIWYSKRLGQANTVANGDLAMAAIEGKADYLCSEVRISGFDRQPTFCSSSAELKKAQAWHKQGEIGTR
jgi:hypothetical protein